MQKRLLKLLLFYCGTFLFLCFAGSLTLHFNSIRQESFSQNFLLALSSVSLCSSAFFNDYGIFGWPRQLTVLLLMQSGAILWLFFSLQFANVIGQAHIFHNFKPGENDILPVRRIAVKVLKYLFLLEAFSAIVIYAFGGDLIEPLTDHGFWAAFHGISIFTNSGEVIPFNFYKAIFHDMYIFQLVVAGILFMGRIGYPVFYDLTNLQRLRQRMQDPKQNWSLQTRISLYSASIILVLGCVVFWLSNQGDLQEKKMVEAAIFTLFNISGWQGVGISTDLPIWVDNFVFQSLPALLMILGMAPGSFSTISYGLYANLLQRRNIQTRKVAAGILVFSAISIFIGLIFLYAHYVDLKPAMIKSISVFTSTGFSFGDEAFFAAPVYVFLLLAGRIGIPAVLVFAYIKFCKNEKPPEIMFI